MRFSQMVLLETIRFLLVFVVGIVLLLFGLLFMDVVGLVVGGGWNEDLGTWPVFASTVSVVVYGSKWTTLVLMLAFGLVCRMVSGPVMPDFMKGLVSKPK